MLQRSFIIKSIKKAYYAHFFILHDVTVTFEQGMSYAIIGTSGSGKTTLLQSMAGIEPPTAGEVILFDHDIYKMSEEHRSQFLHKHIGLVFQSPYLIKELSVLENVMLKGIIKSKPITECQEEAYALLEAVGLHTKIQARPVELSGGQQQRVALARALFGSPSFLLADEPTGNLDSKTGQQIVDLMIQFQKERGMGLIISSHSSYVVEQMQICYEICQGNLVLRRSYSIAGTYHEIFR